MGDILFLDVLFTLMCSVCENNELCVNDVYFYTPILYPQ